MNGNVFHGNEERLSEQAREGYKLIYNDQGSNGAKGLTLKRKSSWVPMEFSIVRDEFKNNLNRLKELGKEGYELASNGYSWGRVWAFYRAKSQEDRTQWDYEVINDCYIENKEKDIINMSLEGWILAARDYDLGNYCILKRDKSDTKKYDIKIISENRGRNIKELEEITSEGWELAARYYYSGHKSVYIKQKS